MSTRTTLKISGITAAVLTVFLAGCFIIKTVNQPSSAIGGSQISATITVSVEGQLDATPHYGIAGFLIPNGWTIDTVYITGAYNDYMTFLHPDSSDKEPGGQMDFWADTLEARYPSGADYQWVVYQSSTAHTAIVDTVDAVINVKMTTSTAQGNFNLGYFVSDAALDFSDNTWYDVSLNNAITISGVVPVELTSFTAAAEKNQVTLNWQTATETNNRGFEIQRRSSNSDFVTIGFVEGKGTSTNSSSYSYTDKNVDNQAFSYRLKQIDFDGSFEYSNIVEVDLSLPADFSISQNYPNPFNPSTSIRFALPVDAKVSVMLYNSLGEVVENLVEGNFTAGNHTINFNAANLTSGTYIYKIYAKGFDGREFAQSNKMVLMK